MSSPQDKLEAIRYSVEAAERRLKQLDEKPTLTRAEIFEKAMTEECIRRGKQILARGESF